MSTFFPPHDAARSLQMDVVLLRRLPRATARPWHVAPRALLPVSNPLLYQIAKLKILPCSN
jgi:hypothetical protein